jgi:hypothetical protein
MSHNYPKSRGVIWDSREFTGPVPSTSLDVAHITLSCARRGKILHFQLGVFCKNLSEIGCPTKRNERIADARDSTPRRGQRDGKIFLGYHSTFNNKYGTVEPRISTLKHVFHKFLAFNLWSNCEMHLYDR